MAEKRGGVRWAGGSLINRPPHCRHGNDRECGPSHRAGNPRPSLRPGPPARSSRFFKAARSSALGSFWMQSAPRLLTGPAHPQPRLIQAVAEIFARLAQHHQIARLGHEGAHRAILPFTTISMPFIEMPQRAEALPSITSRPPRPVAPRRLAGIAFDPHFPRHHVLGDAGAGIAMHDHLAQLVHPGAVISDRSVDLDGDGMIQARGDGVFAAGVDHTPDVSLESAVRPCSARSIRALWSWPGRYRASVLPHIDFGGSGSNSRAFSMPGSMAGRDTPNRRRHSRRVSAITAGLQAMGSRSTAKPLSVPTTKV